MLWYLTQWKVQWQAHGRQTRRYSYLMLHPAWHSHSLLPMEVIHTTLRQRLRPIMLNNRKCRKLLTIMLNRFSRKPFKIHKWWASSQCQLLLLRSHKLAARHQHLWMQAALTASIQVSRINSGRIRCTIINHLQWQLSLKQMWMQAAFNPNMKGVVISIRHNHSHNLWHKDSSYHQAKWIIKATITIIIPIKMWVDLWDFTTRRQVAVNQVNLVTTKNHTIKVAISIFQELLNNIISQNRINIIKIAEEWRKAHSQALRLQVILRQIWTCISSEISSFKSRCPLLNQLSQHHQCHGSQYQTELLLKHLSLIGVSLPNRSNLMLLVSKRETF